MGMGDPEDLTGAVVLLCSDAGKFMTGVDIKIDGKFFKARRTLLRANMIYRRIYYILSTFSICC